jgi:transcription termination factor Rho
MAAKLTNSTKKNLESLKVVELKRMAQEMHIKGYSKMNKQEVIEAIQGTQIMMKEVETMSFEPNFKSDDAMHIVNGNVPPTPKQVNYIHTLERNYYFKIDQSRCLTKASISGYIGQITAMIESGSIVKRPKDEVAASLEHNNIKPIRPASKAQLEYITKLEHETNTTICDIINSSDKANKVINDLLKIKREQKVASKATESIEEKIMNVAKKVNDTKHERFSFKDAIAKFFSRLA